MSTQTKATVVELERLFIEAQALYTAGDLQASLELWRRARTLGQELGDEVREVKALGNIGAVLYALGYLAQAEIAQKEALAHKQERGDLGGQAISLGNLGVIYQEQSNWDAALDCFQQARVLAETTGQRLLTLGEQL